MLKTQSYTNTMLTVIAACLALLTLWGSQVKVKHGEVRVYDSNINNPSSCGWKKNGPCYVVVIDKAAYKNPGRSYYGTVR